MPTEAPAISDSFDPSEALDQLDRGRRPTEEAALIEWLVDADRSVTDPALDRVARAASSQLAALDLLIAVVYRARFARAVIRQVVMSHDDVDDALQNTVLVVASRLDQWNGTGAVRSWIATIAKRQAVQVLRRRQPDRMSPTDDLDQMLETDRFSSRLADRSDIEHVLASLPPRFGQVVWMRDVDRRSYASIADELGVPVNTVRSRLARGRALAQTRLVPPIESQPTEAPGEPRES